MAVACCFPTQPSSSSIDLCTNEDLASVTVNCSLCCKSEATQACKSVRSRRAQRERRQCDGPSPRRVRRNRLRFQHWYPCRVKCVVRPLAPVTISQNIKNCLCFMGNSTSFTQHRNRGTRSSMLVGHVAQHRTFSSSLTDSIPSVVSVAASPPALGSGPSPPKHEPPNGTTTFSQLAQHEYVPSSLTSSPSPHSSPQHSLAVRGTMLP